MRQGWSAANISYQLGGLQSLGHRTVRPSPSPLSLYLIDELRHSGSDPSTPRLQIQRHRMYSLEDIRAKLHIPNRTMFRAKSCLPRRCTIISRLWGHYLVVPWIKWCIIKALSRIKSTQHRCILFQGACIQLLLGHLRLGKVLTVLRRSKHIWLLLRFFPVPNHTVTTPGMEVTTMPMQLVQ